MLGGKNKQQDRLLGYTIVEVIIVLAISGIMFLIAASFINGKQERAAFTVGSNDTGSILQGIVEDITDGHYSDVPIDCTLANPDGSSITFPIGSAPKQGANPECVFLGKIVHFYAAGTAQPQNYDVFSLAAARTFNSNPGIAAVEPAGSGTTLTTYSTIPQNLYVANMHVIDTAGNDHANVYNIGFTQSQGVVTDAVAGAYQSGSQTIRLVYATTLDKTTPGNENAIVNNGIGLNTVQTAKLATICLSDGTKYAKIFVGSKNNNQLSISVQQLGTTAC